jgi:hypothetical protein
VRDAFQILSAMISVITLVSIFRRTRNYGERRRDWLAFIFISLLTLAFYLSVMIDQRADIMNSTDVSSTLRLSVQGVLLAYVLYSPRRVVP